MGCCVASREVGEFQTDMVKKDGMKYETKTHDEEEEHKKEF